MSRYSLKSCEREVQIRFDMEEKVAHIYTSEPMYMRKLDKLVEALPEIYKCVKVDELGYFKKYECPMKFIKFGGKPREGRVQSEEEKAMHAEILRKARLKARNQDASDEGEELIDEGV